MNNLPYNAVMIDLETMSTENNASIVAIGAVKFWLNVKQDEFTIDQLFYTAVDLESCSQYGLHMDPKTVKWWLKQSDEARKALENGTKLDYALSSFYEFVPNQKAYIFGNGSTFDNVILRNAFKAVDKQYPVSYKYDVCFRTLCKLYEAPYPKFEGVKHNALDDAKMQTKYLMDILEHHPWTSK